MRDGSQSGGADELRELHHAATDIMGTSDVEDVYRTTIETARTVLGFDFCSIFEREGESFVVVASSHRDVGETIPDTGTETVLTRTFRKNDPILVENAQENPTADPSEDVYRSAISVPITDTAVMQAVSSTYEYYSKQDLELAELLVVHTDAALEQIRSQNVIEEQKRKIAELHTVATELESCRTHDELFDLMLETSREILGFDWCTLLVMEDGEFVVRMASERSPIGVGARPFPDGDSQAHKVLRTGKSILSRDVHTRDDANPVTEDIRSAVQVPVGDIGVYSVLHHRPNEFDESDVELVELLAASVAEAYERIEIQKQLRERTRELDLFKQVSARMFRHNIRNDLMPIRVYAKWIRDNGDGEIEEYASKIFESATDLLDQTEKAREVGRIVETGGRYPTPLDDAVERAVAPYHAEYGAGVVRTSVDPVTVAVHPKFELAIEELVENAIEHHDGPDRPTVEVYSEEGDDGITLFVEDDGPGIPASEVDVLKAEEETDLKHGSGIGLWLVRWVVGRSNGELHIETTGSGTRVGIRLIDTVPDVETE